MKIVIKVPRASGNMNINPGCREGPEEMIRELENIFLDEEGKEKDFSTDSIEIFEDDYAKTNDNITKKIKAIKQDAIILGGDHSISYPAVKGFASANPGNNALIVLDAHPDCESDFLPPTHEDFIRAIVNENIVPADNITLIGIRNWHKDEEEFLKAHPIKCITGKTMGFEDLHGIIDMVMEKARTYDNVYLSIDIDVVDPAFAPGTGYTEPAGITSRELIYIVQRLKKLPNLRLVDIVEINPKIDKDKITVKLGAKILKELL